jgi:hypothetical protein
MTRPLRGDDSLPECRTIREEDVRTELSCQVRFATPGTSLRVQPRLGVAPPVSLHAGLTPAPESDAISVDAAPVESTTVLLL